MASSLEVGGELEEDKEWIERAGLLDWRRRGEGKETRQWTRWWFSGKAICGERVSC